jgi:predicted NAD/FAD-dependent oxidoreductase
MDVEILIIGAGMAGLACARRLSAAGLAPLVLDKGRGVGGRMATRRAMLGDAPVRFDHGAQYFTARGDDFAALLAQMGPVCAQWADGADALHLVGVPGMSSLPRAMADGLDLRLEAEVTGLRAGARGWDVEAGAQRFRARRVVMTVPAPQAARLLGDAHPLHRPLAAVSMAPCLTLMAAFPADCPRPFLSRVSATEPLAWIAQDSSKPGRDGALVTWVAQASADWSRANLELDLEALALRMLPLLADAIGASPDAAVHFAAHRWRYARATDVPGVPFLRSDDRTLYLGGDWCLGARVEAAFCSGNSVARDLLAAHGTH